MRTLLYSALRASRDLLLFACIGLTSIGSHADETSEPKPGMYRLLVNNDAGVCARVLRLVNREAVSYGRLRMRHFPEVVKWTRSTNPPGISETGDLAYALLDINSDGTTEAVFKTRLNMRGAKDDALYILDRAAGEEIIRSEITLPALRSAGQFLSFLDSQRWLTRAQKLHGDQWERRLYHGLSSIKVAKVGEKLSLLAWNPVASKDDTAKVLAFTLSAGFEVQELCLLGRICPCGGCGDQSSAELLGLVAAPRWCR